MHDPSSREALISEFERLGVRASKPQAGSGWRLATEENAEFALSPTYSSMLAVPLSATEEQMAACAGFRGKRRLPVLVWQHPVTGAALIRGSQPKAGVLRRRSAADELWVRALASSSGEHGLTVVDARPFTNAYANIFRGGGVEMPTRYGCQGRVHFCSIPNIHAVKDAHRSLTSEAKPEPLKWLVVLSKMLKGARRIGAHLADGMGVLLHCSDGWDRTPQLTSLTLLLHDGHSRTREGFASLVEKEWVSFGHRFATRQAEGVPIFLQFLDAVHQLVLQFPAAFE